MRLAQQKVDSRLAAKTDKLLASENQAGLQAGRISLACGAAALRQQWMDQYVKAGGKVSEVCGERVGALVTDPVAAQIADSVFFSKRPKLRQRKLTLSHKDRDLRSEWMDLYVEYGGPVVVVCDPDREKCLKSRKK